MIITVPHEHRRGNDYKLQLATFIVSHLLVQNQEEEGLWVSFCCFPLLYTSRTCFFTAFSGKLDGAKGLHKKRSVLTVYRGGASLHWHARVC